MFLFKVVSIFLLAIVVGAEKKIELQDIEEDNLKSEKQKEYETSDAHSQNSGSEPGYSSSPLEFLKNGFRYFENSGQPPQPTRFVQQYAVTEAPERPPAQVTQKVHYSHPAPQQTMVGYLSNVPMQIYLVPQYYNEAEQGATAQSGVHYSAPVQYTTGPQHTHGLAHVTGYSSAPQAAQTQTNYVEVPSYVAPTAKTYVPQYTSHQSSSVPVTYVSYTAQPTGAPAPTIAPVVTYQVPIVQYSSGVAPSQPARQHAPKEYYQTTHYQDTNAVEEVQESVDENSKPYTHTEITYSKAPTSDFPRYYSARPPQREDYRHNQIQELPHPNSLLLKGPPSHLAHIPKALPMYRPPRPVYGPPPPRVLAERPNEHYGTFKRRPTSLLDSYVPSRLQVEYMKRGFTNDPLQAYEALSSGHHFSHTPVARHFERGFLPNQMYHTGAGGVTFGHYKRTPKVDNVPKN